MQTDAVPHSGQTFQDLRNTRFKRVVEAGSEHDEIMGAHAGILLYLGQTNGTMRRHVHVVPPDTFSFIPSKVGKIREMEAAGRLTEQRLVTGFGKI